MKILVITTIAAAVFATTSAFASEPHDQRAFKAATKTASTIELKHKLGQQAALKQAHSHMAKKHIKTTSSENFGFSEDNIIIKSKTKRF